MPAAHSPESTDGTRPAAVHGSADRAGSAAVPVVLWAAVADVVLVLVFVLIGRSSHAEAFSVVGALNTAWPFLAGLAVGWLVSAAWRRPVNLPLPGLVIWLCTVAAGMLLRVLADQGTAVSFIIVASVALGVFLLGWRLAARLVRRRTSPG